MADERTEPQVGDTTWSCPICLSDDVEPLDDPDFDETPLVTVCKECGYSGADEEFRGVVVSIG